MVARQVEAFCVALTAGQGDGAAELFDATGTATLIGSCPPLPAGYTVQPFCPHQHHALEATGALLQFGEGPMVFQDVIVRREIEGPFGFSQPLTRDSRAPLTGAADCSGPAELAGRAVPMRGSMN